MTTPQNIDWNSLTFSYTRTHVNLRCYWRGGAWGPVEEHTDENLNLHMAATALHYGQAAFEGLKAFRGKDGKIRIFRMEENAKRMASSARYLQMAEPPVDLFCSMVRRVVELNADFTPPYEANGSLYIRPVLFGTGPQVGVRPADEYVLILFATPVGPYYKGGIQGINVMVDRDHDRAAPRGTGHIKSAGNYGASLTSSRVAHEKGFAGALYLDPQTHKYIDECGTANFFGIRKGVYITPASPSILPSITNMSLRTLAEELGLKVEARPVKLKEVKKFEEIGACGTAAVITPIASLFDPATGKTLTFGSGPGPWSQKLYDTLTGIQRGDLPDTHGWVTEL